MKVGITGHQDLSNYDITWLQQSIKLILSKNEVEIGYSSLAIGADQLFVRTLIEFQIDYGVVVPCRHYRKTFKSEFDKKEYSFLLEKAHKALTLDFEEPSEDAFYQAGIKIIEFSDALLAVWDGKPAKGLGGTGDIVEYAKASCKKVFHINPVNETVQLL
jgi:hypothetical protein